VQNETNIAPFYRASQRHHLVQARRRSPLLGEHAEQAALIRWAEFARARLPELALLHAIPNGGHRHKATAARLKAEGVKRGVPDVCLPVARSGAHGLYIELKTERGKPTPEQLGWIRALRRQGYAAEVCRGWESARSMIEHYLTADPHRGPALATVIPSVNGANHDQAA
jgi:VRR-NUC domain